MTVLKINYKGLFAGILAMALLSCSNLGDDLKNNGDSNLDADLSEAIANTAEVSKFNELLTKTGYDKVLSESKTYTVFAPTNQAMSLVDPAILNDPEKLLFFVQNHIALTSYSSVREQAAVKIKMLSNKYLVFTGSTLIDDATLITADKYAANGIFHIVNRALIPKQNIWQYINDQGATSAMSIYLLSLKELNIYKSDADSKKDAIPGKYADSLTNSYLKNVYNLNNEDRSYTLFLMEDDGYNSEVDKLKPYLNKTTSDSTMTYSRYFTVRDMVFPKSYKPNELPNQLTSRFGVTVPIDKTQIVGEPIILSNGIIYRMKKVDVPLSNRLVTHKIEGENNTSYSPVLSSIGSKIFYREKKDLFGSSFMDIVVYDTKGTTVNLNYTAHDFYSTKYQVYWRAINADLPNQGIPVVFKQGLSLIRGTKTIQAFPLTDVQIKNYEDVLLGEFTLESAGDIDKIVLISNSATISGKYSLALDYLKFVPVIQ
jgi:hypothetical protein